MNRSIPPLVKHAEHHVEIRPYTGAAHHSAYYRCLDCDKFVAWLTHSETEQAVEFGLVDLTGAKK